MEKNKLGILLFIGSEAVFFALLILAYLYFQGLTTAEPTAGTSLDPLTTGLFSLCLFASSFTVWRAGKSMRVRAHHSRRELELWLLATIILGAIFLFGQGIEWERLIGQGTTISRNLFGTTFFTLTGFHGLHVLIGLAALAILLGLSRTKRLAPSPAAVETISVYWHFVDAVWVVIFSAVYLSTLLPR
jgi:heme/copper-type cytochrome/quinol oxidase subunit 3